MDIETNKFYSDKIQKIEVEIICENINEVTENEKYFEEVKNFDKKDNENKKEGDFTIEEKNLFLNEKDNIQEIYDINKFDSRNEKTDKKIKRSSNNSFNNLKELGMEKAKNIEYISGKFFLNYWDFQ